MLSPPCIGLSLTQAGRPVELWSSVPSTPMSPLHSPVTRVTSARSLQGPDVMA